MSSQPPRDASGPQDPVQGRTQHLPQQPYGQQTYPPRDQQYGQQGTGQYQAQPPYPGPPDGPPGGQLPPPGHQPGDVPPPRRRDSRPWPYRHRVLAILIAAALLIAAGAVGAAAAGTRVRTVTEPGPTVTTQQFIPGPTVTETVTPTANAQGEATEISADGVYVIGQDIPGGTWHTSGGSQCYEATLSGLDTVGNDIISNNNFTGPDTVDLDGAKAFNITGGCTWDHEG